MLAKLVASKKTAPGTPTRRNVPAWMALVLEEKGRVTPHRRGLGDAPRGDVVGADTAYQATSISKTVAELAERYRWPQRASWPE